MSRAHVHARAAVRPFIPGQTHKQYLVGRREDVWFISFEGVDYGPYKSEREAMLFAVDAANKLGEQGEEPQVLVIDENGDAQSVWTFGHDPFPPRL